MLGSYDITRKAVRPSDSVEHVKFRSIQADEYKTMSEALTKLTAKPEIPRPASLDRFNKQKSKREQLYENLLREIEYLTQQEFGDRFDRILQELLRTGTTY